MDEDEYDDFGLGMDPEEAGFADGAFDGQMDNAEYASYGASIDVDSLTDDERDNYEQSYLAGLDANRNR